MMGARILAWLLIGLTLWFAALACTQEPIGITESPDFDQHVRPILEAHCYECHGRHQQKAGLRLDQRAAALAGSSFGEDPVLVPGDRAASLLWEMITYEIEEERMPPPDSSTLSEEEIEVLGRWIDAGVPWPEDGEPAAWPSKHWAYQKPSPGAPPAMDSFPEKLREWSRTPVDRFLLSSLVDAGLQPQPDADPGQLLRRATLDLTGFPPTVEQLDQYLSDPSPDAYSNALKVLMDSQHYGEQQAMRWLDLARYADSNGYEKDEARSIWLFRDWVIDAYNQDLGYDQFTLKQIAGDLLPEADTFDLIATGFHRNTMINEEGGTDDEEFRVAAVKDRADTTATVWLGSTIGCAQCHNHKYDPFTQRDYYQLYAYFDQTEDGGKANEPLLAVETPRLLAEKQATEKQLALAVEAFAQRPPTEVPMVVGETSPLAKQLSGDWNSTIEPDSELGPELRNVRWRTAEGFQQFRFEGAELPLTVLREDLFYVYVWIDPKTPPNELLLQFHEEGGGWEHRVFFGEEIHALGQEGKGALHMGKIPESGKWQRLEVRPADVNMHAGSRVDGIAFGQADGRVAWGSAGLLTSNPSPTTPLPKILSEKLKRLAQPATTLVMRAVKEPRVTHLLEKGNFLAHGSIVNPAVPSVLRSKRHRFPSNRLGLAQWIVSSNNPLTARVEVNRVWQQVFGTGIVATVDDFGSQGAAPSHPELLDWLAVEFMKNGWSRKWLLQLLMESSAYRQASTHTDEALQKDPNNRWLSHFPRLRLPGENLRDMHLFVSQLLTPRIGGPSVYPPQPVGYDAATYTGDRWLTDSGQDRFRRGLYTFWRRTSPYPSFVLFDATSRELLCARRDRSNTPLQALALLNDPAFAETTRAFAERIQALELDDASRITFGFRTCTGRFPTEQELALLTQLLDDAGWESVARVLLNLDETINRG